jgi:hypothetical protein
MGSAQNIKLRATQAATAAGRCAISMKNKTILPPQQKFFRR